MVSLNCGANAGEELTAMIDLSIAKLVRLGRQAIRVGTDQMVTSLTAKYWA